MWRRWCRRCEGHADALLPRGRTRTPFCHAEALLPRGRPSATRTPFCHADTRLPRGRPSATRTLVCHADARLPRGRPSATHHAGVLRGRADHAGDRGRGSGRAGDPAGSRSPDPRYRAGSPRHSSRWSPPQIRLPLCQHRRHYRHGQTLQQCPCQRRRRRNPAATVARTATSRGAPSR